LREHYIYKEYWLEELNIYSFVNLILLGTCMRFNHIGYNGRFPKKIELQESIASYYTIQNICKGEMLCCTLLCTPIPPLSTWTNNIVKKIGSHYTLSTISHIIGPSRQGWDRSGMRVYNQAFLFARYEHISQSQLVCWCVGLFSPLALRSYLYSLLVFKTSKSFSQLWLGDPRVRALIHTYKTPL
jgi:hypothetical protein